MSEYVYTGSKAYLEAKALVAGTSTDAEAEETLYNNVFDAQKSESPDVIKYVKLYNAWEREHIVEMTFAFWRTKDCYWRDVFGLKDFTFNHITRHKGGFVKSKASFAPIDFYKGAGSQYVDKKRVNDIVTIIIYNCALGQNDSNVRLPVLSPDMDSFRASLPDYFNKFSRSAVRLQVSYLWEYVTGYKQVCFSTDLDYILAGVNTIGKTFDKDYTLSREEQVLNIMLKALYKRVNGLGYGVIDKSNINGTPKSVKKCNVVCREYAPEKATPREEEKEEIESMEKQEEEEREKRLERMEKRSKREKERAKGGSNKSNKVA